MNVIIAYLKNLGGTGIVTAELENKTNKRVAVKLGKEEKNGATTTIAKREEAEGAGPEKTPSKRELLHLLSSHSG